MTIYILDVLLSQFWTNVLFCSMSSSNCCFMTCMQVSQEAGQVVWYPHLLKNFPQFVVIHTFKGFIIINEAEVDVFFLELSCFLYDPKVLTVWSLVPLPFLNPVCTSGSSLFIYCWSLAWKFLSIILLECGVSQVAQLVKNLPAMPETPVWFLGREDPLEKG